MALYNAFSLYAILAVTIVAVTLQVIFIIKFKGRKDFRSLVKSLEQKAKVAKSDIIVLSYWRNRYKEIKLNQLYIIDIKNHNFTINFTYDFAI